MNIETTIKLPDGGETRIIREHDSTITVSHDSSYSNFVHVKEAEGNSVSVSSSPQNSITVGSGVYQTVGQGNLWGSINGNIINQEDLVQYISTAIDAIPTPAPPTLQEVTDEGTTTDNSIEVGGLTVTTPIKNYNPNIPDIGAKQDNDLRGYGDGYISDKTLSFVRLSEQAKEEEGAVRIKQGAFQAYMNGGWETVVSNFRFREDANGDYELEHKPVGFEWWIEVNSGNSDLLGLNGLPLVQQYKVSMGAYPVPLELDGGTF